MIIRSMMDKVEEPGIGEKIAGWAIVAMIVYLIIAQ